MTNSTLQQLTWGYMDVINTNGTSFFNSKTIEDAIISGASRLKRAITIPFKVRFSEECVGVFSIEQETIFRPDCIIEINPTSITDDHLFGEVLAVLVDQLTGM